MKKCPAQQPDEPLMESRVPTWFDGVILTREDKAHLTPEQWRQYTDDSVVRDLSEIDQMPERMRSWAHAAVERGQARAALRCPSKHVVSS